MEFCILSALPFRCNFAAFLQIRFTAHFFNSCKILPFILKALDLSPLTPYTAHKHHDHESCRLLGKEDRYTLPIKHQQNLRQSHDAIATFFFIIGV
jgi:hypothetical protein